MAGPKSNSVTHNNISATTSAFALSGGKYGITAMATWGGGNVQFQKLAQDGSTWINIGSSITANNYSTQDLPSGFYKWAVTTATAIYLEVAPIVEY